MSEFHGGPQAPQQPYQPMAPKPPKKRHTFRNIAIVVGGLFALLIVAAVLSPGQPAQEAASKPSVVTTVDTGPSPEPLVTPTNKPAAPTSTKPVEEAPQIACAGQEDRNAPCIIQVGKPFQLGKHMVLAGWKVTSQYGTMAITGKARNTGDESSAMFVEVKFLSGDEVLADVSCTTDALEPGQTQAISCFSSDDYTKKYKRVTVEATF